MASTAGYITTRISPELDPYYPGQVVKLTFSVWNWLDTLTTPGSYELKILRPDDTEVDIASLVLEGTGTLSYDLLLDISFRWRIRFETHNPYAVYEHDIVVSGTVFGTGLPAPVGPGGGHEGEVAIVDGGQWQPYAGNCDGQPLIWTSGVGWHGGPINLADDTCAVSGLLAPEHIAPSDTEGYVLTTAGGVAQWAAPTGGGGGGGGGTPGLPFGSLQYNNAGGFGGKADIKLLTDSFVRLAFGGVTDNSGSWLEFANSGRALIGIRDNIGTVGVLLAVDNNFGIVSFGSPIVSLRIASQVKSGGDYYWDIGGATKMTLTSGVLDVMTNAVSHGTQPAGVGDERFSSLQTVFVRNTLNTLDQRVFEFGDNLSLGDLSVGGHIFYDVGAGKAHIFRVLGAGEYTLDATKFHLFTNYVTHGTNSATAGVYNTENGVVIAAARDNLNLFDITALRVDNVNKVFVGDAVTAAAVVTASKSGGFWENRVNNIPVQHFDEVNANFLGVNVINAAYYAINGIVPAAGYLRVPNGGVALLGLMSIKTDNVTSLRLISSANDDAVYVSDSNSSALYLRSGADVRFRPTASATDTMRVNDSFVYLANSVTVTTADPVGGGLFYEEGGALKHRGSSGTLETMAAA